jgi:hypothetical protein
MPPGHFSSGLRTFKASPSRVPGTDPTVQARPGNGRGVPARVLGCAAQSREAPSRNARLPRNDGVRGSALCSIGASDAPPQYRPAEQPILPLPPKLRPNDGRSTYLPSRRNMTRYQDRDGSLGVLGLSQVRPACFTSSGYGLHMGWGWASCDSVVIRRPIRALACRDAVAHTAPRF